MESCALVVDCLLEEVLLSPALLCYMLFSMLVLEEFETEEGGMVESKCVGLPERPEGPS